MCDTNCADCGERCDNPEKPVALICDSCHDTEDRLDECLRCSGKFCIYCSAFGYCEDCIEEMGLIAEKLEWYLEQQKAARKPCLSPEVAGYDRGYLAAIQYCIRIAKGEQLP